MTDMRGDVVRCWFCEDVQNVDGHGPMTLAEAATDPRAWRELENSRDEPTGTFVCLACDG